MTTNQWWMYHGDAAHSGYAGNGGSLTVANIKAAGGLKVVHELELGGPILSIPSLVDGFIYVGLANSAHATGMVGGSFMKIDIASGTVAATFTWDIPLKDRDSHGFCGMGSSPAAVDARVTFSAFDGKVYCLSQADLSLVWKTDLRYPDPAQNQPLRNDFNVYPPGDPNNPDYPPAAGWSSPLVVGDRVYVGFGEGENPYVYSYVYCLDAASGKVVWVYCTNQFRAGEPNQVGEVPAEALPCLQCGQSAPAGFIPNPVEPVTRGCSVWGSIAYDAGTASLYCPTGNANGPNPSQGDSPLPTPGWSNGLLALDATTGAFKGFYQTPPESSYRPSDLDVDVGASPTVFQAGGRTLVGIGSKNGSYFILDAADVSNCLRWRQLLPCATANGHCPPDHTKQIETVDPHAKGAGNDPNIPNPTVPNEVSNATQAENYSGLYSCAAVHPGLQRLFVGLGGNNYHTVQAGIDCTTTPFMRALNIADLTDAWPMDSGIPPKYAKAAPPMYNAGESGLSSPAVVNDVVFMATTGVAVHAFDANDGTHLWTDTLGAQTGGMNGGYGYCMGPAVWGDYLVAGGLVFGRDGGILRIYSVGGE
jgi:outer membrane protein assembly factor BamB